MPYCLCLNIYVSCNVETHFKRHQAFRYFDALIATILWCGIHQMRRGFFWPCRNRTPDPTKMRAAHTWALNEKTSPQHLNDISLSKRESKDAVVNETLVHGRFCRYSWSDHDHMQATVNDTFCGIGRGK